MVGTQREKTQPFHVEASEVLTELRSSVTDLLASAGGLRKPSELQKLFRLEPTLSWQIFQVAGANLRDVLSVGPSVPSRSALKKFLAAAVERGVDSAKVDRVWTDYKRFEDLIDVHAGDRTSFNSMAAAASGSSEDSEAVDLAHRRNGFRTMSHVLGIQAAAKVSLGIINESSDANCWEIAVLQGHLALRILRRMPAVNLFSARLRELGSGTMLAQEPLCVDEAVGGHLLEKYSTPNLPPLKVRDIEGLRVITLQNPEIGNLGSTSAIFGTRCRNHPIPSGEKKEFWTAVGVYKPVELILSDVLVNPKIMRGALPSQEVVMRVSKAEVTDQSTDTVPLEGNYRLEKLGIGPGALSTTDVPRYPEMVRAAAEKLGWDVNSFQAWRVRIEYPIYNSSIRIKWVLP
jgi:hypothetical protein